MEPLCISEKMPEQDSNALLTYSFKPNNKNNDILLAMRNFKGRKVALLYFPYRADRIIIDL